MGYSNVKFEAGIASGASTSSYIDTGGRAFNKMAVGYVTMSTAAEVTVYGCDTATGTYRAIKVADVNTAAAEFNVLTIGSAVSGSYWAIIDATPFRYMHFRTSAVVSGGVSFTVLCNGNG
jgi:hypothetical protein